MSLKSFRYEELKEFDSHHMVLFVNDSKTNLKGFIAIHRGSNGTPSFGATRVWTYPEEIDALNDVLRLSKLMSYKSALAGLPYGGAKAVIFSSTNRISPVKRDSLFRAYAQRVNYLHGHFITGSDVGVSLKDVETMAKESPYIVGTKSDPTRFTGLGICYAIETCLNEVFGTDSVKGRSFAIQGLGKTGHSLLEQIYQDATEVYVSDINTNRVKEIKREFPKVKPISPQEIHKQKVDVFSPCALSHAINLKNLSSLHCKIVAGSANNQLEDKQIGVLLHKLGILYAPDYIVNSGGIIAVADEYQHKNFNEERVTKKVKKIKATIKTVLDKSNRTHKAVSAVADEMAEKIFNKIV